MASFLTKPKTKSETFLSTLQVQFKEIPNEDVGQDETLSEVIAVLETNDYMRALYGIKCVLRIF